MLVELSDKDGDDFIRGVVAIKATRPDGVSRTWKIPRRLMNRPGICDIAVAELIAEMNEGVSHRR